MVSDPSGPLSDNLHQLLCQVEAGESVDGNILLAVIRQQEKQSSPSKSVEALAGTWQLVWTSGTRQYQTARAQKVMARSQSAFRSIVLQRIDPQTGWFENQVRLPLGQLTVAGPFTYSATRRIEFTFTRLQLQLGRLPALPLPLGNWAKGWLQTTYLDDLWHIERGDRGGISVYRRQTESAGKMD